MSVLQTWERPERQVILPGQVGLAPRRRLAVLSSESTLLGFGFTYQKI